VRAVLAARTLATPEGLVLPSHAELAARG